MDPLMGEIRLFAFDYAPLGWMRCDGSRLSPSQNAVLFFLIGTTYGGDGTTDFAIPDLRDKGPNDATHYCICVRGSFPQKN
jgi:microcystin-dependent protein